MKCESKKRGQMPCGAPLCVLGAHQVVMGQILYLCIISVLLGWSVTVRSSNY